MTEEQSKLIATMLQNNIGNTLTSELATGMLVFLRNVFPVEQQADDTDKELPDA